VRDARLAVRKAGYVPYYYLMYGLSKFTDYRLMGESIWDRDWDVLLILDACRYDVFEELYGSDQRFEIEAMFSAGSASPEWMFNNFGRKHADELSHTVYVTGNPYSSKCLTADVFDHVEEVWRHHWDEDQGTVMPDVLSDEAIRVWNDRDPDRMIVHYMQPHKPYIPAPDSAKMKHSDFTINLFRVFATRALGTYPDFKKAEARRDNLPDSELRELYNENLEYVVDTLDRTILRNIDADIVISSDHGELLGEEGIYHHPAFTRYAELRTVPWARVNVTPDGQYSPRQRIKDGDNGDIEEKLEALGYKQ